MDRLSAGRSERRGLLLLLAPFLVGIVALVLAPASITFAASLFDADLIRAPSFVGLDNYRELLRDDVFRVALRNSLVFAAWAVPLRVGGAFALALLVFPRFRGAGTARTSVYVPTVVPDVAFAIVWLWLLNPLYGPINLALGAVGAPTPAWLTEPAAAQAGVVLMAFFQLGEGFLLALAARALIPDRFYDVVALEGAGAWSSFRRVTLPLLVPAILLLAFRDTVFSFQAGFVPALVVTEGGPPPYATTTLPLFAYRTAFEYLRYGYAAGVMVVMFVLTAAAVWLQYRIVSHWRSGMRASA